MTLDEAIKHADEVAEEKKKDACELYDAENYEESRECIWCAEEHRQLAEWLKELKQLREQTKWIPVSEKLPKECEYIGDVCKYYLVQDEYEDMHVAHFCKRGWEPIESTKALGCDVVAWMPLPEPYKTESEE